MLEDITGQGDAPKELERQKNEALKEVTRLKTHDMMRRLAVQEGFIDGDMAAKLIASRVRLDRGIVTGVDGRDVREILKDFARDNPFMTWDAHPELQRPSFKPVPPVQLTPEERDIARAKEVFSDSEKANKLAINNLAEYHRLKAIARFHGIVKY